MRTRMTSMVGLFVLALGLLVLSGCNATLKATDPALPPGFTDAVIPDGDVAAYIYVSQGSPISVATDRFGKVENMDPETRKTFVIPHVLEANRLALWSGSTLDSFASSVEFGDDASAQFASQLLSSMPDKATSWQNGLTVNAVRGTGDWATSMESVMKGGQGSTIETANPAVWDLLHVLPEKPPGSPVAVGYAHVDAALMDSLSSKAGLDLQGLGQAFGAVNVQDIAAIIYSENPVVLDSSIGPDYFNKQGLSALFVAQSTYPGFVLSFFLGSFSDRIGLEKGPAVQGHDTLVKELNGAHLMLATLGNTFFLALAPTQDKVEALMGSALEPQA